MATSICKIVGGLSFLIAALLLFIEEIETSYIREDEMFTAHMKAAKAKSLNIVTGGLMLYCITITILWKFIGLNIERDWRAIALAIIGFAKLITFMYFRHLEKTGWSYY